MKCLAFIKKVTCTQRKQLIVKNKNKQTKNPKSKRAIELVDTDNTLVVPDVGR